MAEETVEELKAKLEKVNAEKAELQEKLDLNSGLIDDMQNTIDKQAAEVASGSNLPTVKVDKKEYQIRVAGKIRFQGKDYTASDIQKNKKLAAVLVEKEVACMIEVK